MTMLDERGIRIAMRKKLKTVATLPKESLLAWENHRFEPPELTGSQRGPVTVWVEEAQRVLQEAKTSNGFIEAVGQTLWSVYAPKGRGTADLDELSKAIAEAFEAGQSVTGTGLTVILERTDRSELRPSGAHENWVFKVVTVRWRVFTPSSTVSTS